MNRNIVDATVKQLRHGLLGHPDGLIFQNSVDVLIPFRCSVEKLLKVVFHCASSPPMCSAMANVCSTMIIANVLGKCKSPGAPGSRGFLSHVLLRRDVQGADSFCSAPMVVQKILVTFSPHSTIMILLICNRLTASIVLRKRIVPGKCLVARFRLESR